MKTGSGLESWVISLGRSSLDRRTKGADHLEDATSSRVRVPSGLRRGGALTVWTGEAFGFFSGYYVHSTVMGRPWEGEQHGYPPIAGEG